jgi:hypothetical protein
MQEGNFVFRALSVEFCVLRFWVLGCPKGNLESGISPFEAWSFTACFCVKTTQKENHAHKNT